MDRKKLEELFIRFCKPKNVQTGGFLFGATDIKPVIGQYVVKTCQPKAPDSRSPDTAN
jgi:hypothetical protein